MTARDGHDFWAALRPDSPRYADWLKVYGPEAILGESGIQVPITTPIPERVQLPIGVRSVFFVKLDRLSAEQRERLIRHLVERFGVPRAEVEADFRAKPGRECPILDEDVWVTILHPQRWF